jgi:hypothetical protein
VRVDGVDERLALPVRILFLKRGAGGGRCGLIPIAKKKQYEDIFKKTN